ncbi:MAG: hypothetical protein AB7J34_08000 [Limisphaerales bacterium]
MTRLNPRPNPPPKGSHPRLRAVLLARTPGLTLFAVTFGLALALALAFTLAGAPWTFAALSAQPPSPSPAAKPPPAPDNPPSRHPVTVRNPLRQPRVETGTVDSRNQPVTVSCGSCHATSTPRPDTRFASDLDEFHQGLRYQHGDLTCLSCHDAANYDQLRLADARGLPFPEAMTLCAQCHGPQFRDYSNGSHGGMTGFWDLSKGPRQRNHCVDCHDPHAPQFPIVQPAFPLPVDRGLNPPSAPHAAPDPTTAPTPAPHHG